MHYVYLVKLYTILFILQKNATYMLYMCMYVNILIIYIYSDI